MTKDGVKKWHCKIDDQEIGPLNSEELKQMVEDGNLGPDDTVRQEKSDLWIPAKRVKGLFEGHDLKPSQTTVSPDAPSTVADPPAEASPPATSRKAALEKNQKLIWAWAAAVGLSMLLICVVGWYSSRGTRFPKPTMRDPSAVPPPSRAPIPAEPTYERLPVGVPVPVPGLEKVPTAFSPYLTSDQRIIVFSGIINSATGYEIYIATRDDKNAPFGQPKLIKSCVSPATNAYPTLRDDGLELFYRHRVVNSEFMHCRRNSLTEEFGAPVVWKVPGLTLGKDANLSTPQFLSDLELQFGVFSPDIEQAGQYISKRTTSQSEFGKPDEIPFTDPSPPYFVSQSQLRAYFGLPSGIYMSVRESTSTLFGQFVKIVDASVSGPIDGTVYVTPKEDVIIYCSPGLNGPAGRRSLWMLRY